MGVGRHGLMGKQNLYDHSMRIPLIMRGPGIPAGLRSDAMLYLLDMFPTILEFAGVDPPESAGRSITELLAGETDAHRQEIFSAYQGLFGHPGDAPYQRSLKNARYKLIQSVVDGAETWQFFDLHEDPLEMRDLIDDLSQAAVIDQLRRDLRAQQQRFDDPLVREAAP